MRISKAVAAATRFCQTKGEGHDSYVQFRESHDGPACVFGIGERVGCVVWLDDDVVVPNVALPATPTKLAFKDADYVDQWNATDDLVSYDITTPSEAKYRFSSTPWRGQPIAYPPIPTSGWRTFQGATHVKRLLHAVSKDKHTPILQYVHFAEEYVETSDSIRVARSWYPTEVQGTVPSELFKQMPRGQVEVVDSGSFVFFRFGEEIRFAAKGNVWPAVIGTTWPHVGNDFRVVRTDQFVAAIDHGIKQSTTKAMMLRFQGNMIHVHAWRDRQTPVFVAAIEGDRSGLDGEVTVNGAFLIQAVKSVPSPAFLIHYRGPEAPITLQSGRFAESLWPQRKPEIVT